MSNKKDINNPEFGLSSLRLKPLVLTAGQTIKDGVASFIELNHATVLIPVVIPAPTKGHLLIIRQKDAGTAGHTVTLTAGTFDGSNNIATLNAKDECIVLFGVSATRYVIVENIGSVGLS